MRKINYFCQIPILTIIMSPNTPVKKAWTEPSIVLISSANIETAKSHPTAHENTGHVNTQFPSVINTAYNGNAFMGTIYQAVS